jgi:hypothetical protein
MGQRASAHRIKNHGRVSLHRHRVLVTAQGSGIVCVKRHGDNRSTVRRPVVFLKSIKAVLLDHQPTKVALA